MEIMYHILKNRSSCEEFLYLKEQFFNSDFQCGDFRLFEENQDYLTNGENVTIYILICILWGVRVNSDVELT